MPIPVVQPHKSSIGGIDANLMAMLAYTASFIISFIPGLRYAAWLAPIIIFFIEKDSPFVRFHAIQAVALQCLGLACGGFVTLAIGGALITSLRLFDGMPMLAMVGIVGLLGLAVSGVMLVFLVIGTVKAFQYQEYRLPLAGRFAARLAALFGGLART